MIVGITGLIGSGKSLIGARFHDVYDMDVVDCDDIAHGFYENTAIVNRIEEIVGQHRSPDNSFNRKSLFKYLMKNPSKVKYINDILHPPVINCVRETVIRYRSKNWHLVVLVPLLFECHMEKQFDATIYVYTDYEIRVKRLIEGRGINKKQMEFCDNLQIPAEKKFLMCDYVLLNNSEHDCEINDRIEELFYRIF